MLFENVNDFAFAIVTETTKAIETAHAMVDDARRASEAKAEAQRHTDCRACQAGMENYLLDTPSATFTEKEEAHRGIWETCLDCQVEYAAWADKAAEAAAYCELDGHAFNGDDLRWQNGGGVK